ncbi:helix-turn-helix domain-containing protein [Paenibacillus sp. 481]|uniref:helix-turn-helix domain-containing protein n=1 Tax=Paenibacillus sp. 481 TaxID=2835869 RepID=UPI001E370AD0|nr:helix-turn-helix domain-containing protein [Paenibacillus sp. 481]UHA72134.1 helix-turn-helix domain-containing protein [Paenibacillus sp. 481]
MGTDTAILSTLGQLIQQYRRDQGVTFQQLSDRTGVKQESIVNIENGISKRPDYFTIQSLATALNIPLIEIVERFLLIEQRSEELLHMLKESASMKNASITTNIAFHFLASQDEDSFTLLHKLYDTVQQLICDAPTKLFLYDIIINFGRSHGIQSCTAKGALQKYFVERNDFSKLQETFYSGKYVLHYVPYLSNEERISLYYKLGVHAYNLRKFDECIELCEKVIIEDEVDSNFKAYSTLAICSSYYYQEKYDLAEVYLGILSSFDSSIVDENILLMTGLLNSKKGEVDLAIKQLQQSFQTAAIKINVVTELFDLYLFKNNFEAIEDLLKMEFQFTESNMMNPYLYSEYAHYYLKKGGYLSRVGQCDEAVDSLVKSIAMFGKINGLEGVYECMELMFHALNNNSNSKAEMQEKVTRLFMDLKLVNVKENPK